MIRPILRLHILTGVLTICMTGSASAEKAALHYRLQVRIQPALHQLEAEAWIRHPPASQFYLFKGLSVREVIADGRPVPFHTDSSAAPLPYVPMATAVDVDAQDIQQLQVTYGGEISEVVAGVNMITPDLVELASYAGWYPEYQGARRFTFELQANVPKDFVTITNGRKKSVDAEQGRLITEWSSYETGMDMVLLASPHFHQAAAEDQGNEVELYYYRLPPKVLKAKMDGLAAGMKQLTSLYGPPRVKGILRLVYSPRAGWGYSRIPLVVMSEERARELLRGANGEANDFHNNCHEMAHFWWSVADPATPSDWINEGLAEFTAFRLTEGRFGEAFAQARLAEYRKDAGQNKTTTAIAETTSDSPDRYINRYEKTTMMFLEAQNRFGKPALNRVLKAIHTRFAGTGQATTALFLEEVNRQMGKKAAVFFRTELYRRPPSPTCERKRALVIKRLRSTPFFRRPFVSPGSSYDADSALLRGRCAGLCCGVCDIVKREAPVRYKQPLQEIAGPTNEGLMRKGANCLLTTSTLL